MESATSTKRFSLTGKDPGGPSIDFDEAILVGREESAVRDGKQLAINLVVSHRMVSGLHARISPDEQGLVVEDLGSRNGTFINDQRLTKPTRARHGDEVRFDNVIFTVADRQPPARSEKPGTPAANARGTEVRDDADAGAKKGGTRFLGQNKGLPEDWVGRAGTVNLGDLTPKQVDELTRNQKQVGLLEKQTKEPTLWFLSGPNAGTGVCLRTDGHMNFWNIGSDPVRNELAIIISDTAVSGLHAKIVHRNGQWHIKDLLASNPVRVNGQVRSPAYLSSTDHLLIGRVSCLFLLPRKGPGVPVAQVRASIQKWRWPLATVLLILALCVAWLTFLR